MQVVLFDNDGTIADTQGMILESFRHATDKVLHESFPDEAYLAKSGIPLADMMADFTGDPLLQQELLDAYRAYNHQIHDERIALFEGELEALAALQAKGLALGVVTSKLHALAARGLDVLGLTPYMGVLVAADDCERAKPDPAPVLMGCAALDVAPAHAVYVGDAPFDIQAGKAAGCATIGVTWGMHAADVLRREKPDALVSSFAELPDAVASLG